MKHLFFIVLLCLLSGNLQAQDTTYYNDDWEVCTRLTAAYYGFFEKENGLWVGRDYYTINDQIQSENFFQDKKRETRTGVHRYWEENGQLYKLATYQEGLRQGKWQEWYASGQLKASGQYEEDVAMGDWAYFYENGQKKADVVYTPTWTVKNYWQEDGEKTIENGEGELKSYWSNGVLKREGKVENSVRIGSWICYSPDGDKLEEVRFNEAGEAHGLHQYWYPSGALEYRGQRKNGRKIGTWMYFSEDGSLLSSDKKEYNEDEPVYFLGEREPEILNLALVKRLIGYPQKAINRGVEGMVYIKVVVGQDGHYKSHTITGKSNKILTAAVEQKISLVKFIPCIEDGKKVLCRVTVPFGFKLEG
ncbi:MAG: energy transducer TonB [Bacteroidota bacterium]